MKVLKVVKMKKIVFFVIIFGLVFVILYYKNFLFGNNISKNRLEDKVEKFLKNTNYYSADLNVTVKSNKTENNYTIHQEINNDYSVQEIIDGENVTGVKIEKNGNNLKILNSKLNLEKIYENYQDLLNNALFLDSFASDYSNDNNNVEYYEKDDEIIIEINISSNENTYIKHKKLYINSQTLKPTKLEVRSHLKSETICIIYSNVEFISN